MAAIEQAARVSKVVAMVGQRGHARQEYLKRCDRIGRLPFAAVVAGDFEKLITWARLSFEDLEVLAEGKQARLSMGSRCLHPPRT